MVRNKVTQDLNFGALAVEHGITAASRSKDLSPSQSTRLNSTRMHELDETN